MAKKSDKGSGYGKPPQHTRFKPGQSGNPRGRPKGSLNFTTDLKTVLLAPVAVNDGGRSRRVTTQKAALLRLREKALKGDVRALDRFLSLAMAMSVGSAEETATSLPPEDQAILEAYRRDVLADADATTASQRDEEDAT
ncbi:MULTISPECIES: DUF5681 domain-containing protein [Bradyrhizobium]|uniref:DUF5681 domain-containing protein n=1 Tax=Bradyrhizobium canariense TaxID=255045 RepID=A0A1X3GT20_9BRAD|nr:DUF5681 domain-containing protein [Bradyrhizobium canariense]OSI78165.1 hypothetical protein BSZ22_03165 [Bradyrhizobium canariense]OSI82265.1 hypothetical protein BSZ23_02425 [Bradyrhizobium canariense]OSI96068.1 hypothetical protein BSZ25_02990 [Bradyrhizobium canariense]OSI96607.1 hypothetical protein BSZ24_03915 [Bradyrhizobium canariense]OSJ04059.1 hypothetical protein BSZ16_15310 [Bradyrhizobium canariense]